MSYRRPWATFYAHDVLAAPAATDRPEDPIMDAALEGSLDEKTLARLLPAAAQAAMCNGYRRELARSSENVLLGQFHRQLKAGAADDVTASMRANFDKHAEQIAHAKTLIDPESSVEHILATGEPGVIQAWQQLPGHLQVVSRIGLIAAQFGASPVAQFGQVTQYALAENHRIADTAIMATSGPLAIDSALFLRPDQGGRTSPWFRCGGLRLWSVDEARSRYNEFAASEFDRVHSGPRGGYIGEDNQVHYDRVPPNPYREKASAR